MTDSRPRVDAAALSTLTMRQCTGLLKPLMKMEDAALFLVPVDAVALKLDDYHTIVTEPMDLGTIEKKLDKSGYSSVEDFIRDVRLVWGNALKYNPPENPVYALADRMDAEFEKKLAELSGVPLTTAPAAGAAPATAAKGPAVPFKDVKALLKILDNHKLSAPFRTPVDWEKGGLTNYLQVVERPMDLGTIGAKLDGAEPYATTAELLADVDLVWAKCIKYNGEGAWISEHAQQLREHTAKKVKQLGWKEGATITPEPAKKPPAEKKAPPPPKPKAAPAPKPAAAPKAAAGQKRKKPEAAAPPAAAPAPAAAAPPPAAAGGTIITLGACKKLLKPLAEDPSAFAFNVPVDWQKYGLNDYPKIVKKPMDLGTIKTKLEVRETRLPRRPPPPPPSLRRLPFAPSLAPPPAPRRLALLAPAAARARPPLRPPTHPTPLSPSPHRTATTRTPPASSTTSASSGRTASSTTPSATPPASPPSGSAPSSRTTCARSPTRATSLRSASAPRPPPRSRRRPPPPPSRRTCRRSVRPSPRRTRRTSRRRRRRRRRRSSRR